MRPTLTACYLQQPDNVFPDKPTKDDIVNIHCSTLKSYFHAKASEQAFGLSYKGALDDRFNKRLAKTTKHLMDNGTIRVNEFIKRDNEGNIFVCLDHETVDSNFMDVALELIEKYNVKPGQYIALGEPKQFTSTDITYLIRH